MVKKYPKTYHDYLSPALAQFTHVSRLLHHFDIYIELPDDLPEGQKVHQTVFAATHSNGYNDISFATEALASKYHSRLNFFSGDGVQGSSLVLLKLNGAVVFNRFDRESRHQSKINAIAKLKNGENLWIAPEATLNLLSYLPTLPLFAGPIDIAEKSGADLRAMTEIHTLTYGRIVISEKVDPTLSREEKREALRTAMSTALWMDWERNSDLAWDENEQIYKRKDGREIADLPSDVAFAEREKAREDWEKLRQNWVDMYDVLIPAVEQAAIRHDWDTPEEVWAPIARITGNTSYSHFPKSAFGGENSCLQEVHLKKYDFTGKGFIE